MPLESSFNFISDLNPSNPATTDNVSQGDDHLRGIKNAVQGSFNGFTGGVTDITEAQLAALAAFVDNLYDPVYCQISRPTATVWSPSGGATWDNIAAFTATNVNNGCTVNLTNGTIEVPTTGDYLLHAHAYLDSSVSGSHGLRMGIGINSADPPEGDWLLYSTNTSIVPAEADSLSITVLKSLSASDLVRFKLYQTVSNNVNTRNVVLLVQRVG